MQSTKTPSYNQFQLHFAAGLISSWDPIASQALFHIQHPIAGASVGHPHTPSKNKVTKWGQQWSPAAPKHHKNEPSPR